MAKGELLRATESFAIMSDSPLEKKMTAEMPESEFAKKTGLPMDHVQELREALLRPDEFRVDGRQVILSPGAVARLGDNLCEALSDGEEQTPALEAVAATVKRQCRNPRLVKAETASGETVTVRVPVKTPLRPGAAIKITQPGNGAIWKVVSEKKSGKGARK